eukprot:gene3414-3877_t
MAQRTTATLVFLIFALLVSISVGAPLTKKIVANIFDHHPLKNPDFEYKLQHGDVTPNLVSKVLPVSGIPQFVGNRGDGAINSAETFNQWFVSTPGINIPMEVQLVLTQTPNDESKYAFTDDYFFPIDNKGWDELKSDGTPVYPNLTRYTDQWSKIDTDPVAAKNGKYHNFHFCLHLKATFSYKGNEVFTFRGDDDVWVYFNNKLAVDLGGIHEMANTTIDLATLGLSRGEPYTFDFFYCERHADRSELQIETEMEFYCTYIDYCGVCQGDGSSCCDASICSDGNPCTIDACPKGSSNATRDNFKQYCTHTPIKCSSNDPCVISQCVNGGCKETPVQCKSSPCQISQCTAAAKGCQSFNRTCDASDKCTRNFCDPAQDKCVSEVTNCDDNNPCTEDSCDPAVGCSHIPKNCYDGNPCTTDTCVAGQCVNDAISPCTNCKCDVNKCQTFTCNADASCNVTNAIVTDNNACTLDTCDSADGKHTYSKIQCNAIDPCHTASCDSKTGVCSQIPISCDDNNACTLDTCDGTGKCIYSQISCDDQNPCTIDKCDQNNGSCIHIPVVCDTPNACSIGVCNVADGSCGVQPLVCEPSANFCNVSICDQTAGCVLIPRTCLPSDPSCEKGICDEEKRECKSRPYSPLPFKCTSAAVKAGVAVGAAAIAGIVIGGAAALGLLVFGGKKGYDYWKTHSGQNMQVSNQNPLYEANPNNGENPLYSAAP